MKAHALKPTRLAALPCNAAQPKTRGMLRLPCPALLGRPRPYRQSGALPTTRTILQKSGFLGTGTTETQRLTTMAKPMPLAGLLWLCWLLVLVYTTSAHAQTPVTGAIAANTHWTVAESPYLVSGDVIIQNNAILTIDPGVTVYMAARCQCLTVQAGGVQAHGTATNSINVLSDKSRLAQASAPGDWKQWVFNAGTTNTKLEHVTFEHGGGLTVNGCAPTFNHLNINNHLGAAITLDLAASPAGVGNRAIGNTINGIAVPPGDIKGQRQVGAAGHPLCHRLGHRLRRGLAQYHRHHAQHGPTRLDRQHSPGRHPA